MKHVTPIRTMAALLMSAFVSIDPCGAADPAASPKVTKPENYTQEIGKSKVTFDMVLLPAGQFQMGSPETESGRRKDEGPQIEVEVASFWIGKHEVTWDEYNLFTQSYQIAKELGVAAVPKDRETDAVSFPTPLYQEKLGPVLAWALMANIPLSA